MKTVVSILLLVALALLGWYIYADRHTPYTNNARVKAVVTQVVPQVSGIVTEVRVGNGQLVAPGEVLARIDSRPYDIALARAKADLQSAVQGIGAGSARVEAEQARVSRATADLENVRLQTARVFEMERKGLVSTARADDARARLAEAEAALNGAEADLSRAREELGPEGEDNPSVQRALAALAAAELDLAWTELQAPAAGAVTNLGIAAGAYASAGAPLMTFIDAENVWIEAYMTENNLANMSVGDPVEITLDIDPGRILQGRVESFSAAASIGGGGTDGLAAAPRISGWMRDPQRFPVRIVLPGHERGDSEDDVSFQVNGQADVTVYTGENELLNRLGRWHIRFMSWLSYAY